MVSGLAFDNVYTRGVITDFETVTVVHAWYRDAALPARFVALQLC